MTKVQNTSGETQAFVSMPAFQAGEIREVTFEEAETLKYSPFITVLEATPITAPAPLAPSEEDTSTEVDTPKKR